QFKYKSTTFADTEPTIHVGFVPNDTVTADHGDKPAGGLTTGGIYMNDKCAPTVTMEFPDMNSSMKWSFQSPWDLDIPYYEADDAALKAANGLHTWFRPSFLHELEHAFQLHHTGTAYATM